MMIDKQELLNLPVDDRTLLAHELLASVQEEMDGWVLTPAQQAILDQRLADVKANPDAGVSWEEVKGRLQDRFG